MNRFMIVGFVAGAVALGLTTPASAQTTRNFIVEPGQVVPPSSSTATGQGSATLDVAETQLSFNILHDIPVPDAQSATASVYNADLGSNGPALFALTFVDTNSFNGNWAIDTNSVAEFHAGRLYVRIDTPTFPSGALRGQIDLNPNPQPGDVMITEIMYNPASQEGNFPNPPFAANSEWIELFNTTVTDIQIGGWFFQDEDVDTNGDLCAPLQGGTFPSFVLRSFRTVVVIPDGDAFLGVSPNVTDFKDAWFGVGGGADVDVIQINTNGTSGGAIVGNNLSNSPANDGFSSNDLPLSSTVWQPCNALGFMRLDNEILTLNDGTQIIDVVNYGDEFDSRTGAMDWPDQVFGGSITIAPADQLPNPPSGFEPQDFSTYNAVDNDLGFNWWAHTHGDNLGAVRQIGSAGVYGGLDVGSPGRLLGTTQGNLAPAAIGQQVLMGPGQTVDIFLDGTDFTRPFFGLLLFVIRSVPVDGQLIDVASSHVITQADVQGQGYLMPRIPFNHVQYVNAGTCGLDQFTFSTHDGLLQSVPQPVELFVQCGDVVITEIMYNPDSTENNPPKPEWVELYNTTSNALDLAGWYMEDNAFRSGDFPSYILGAGSTVVAIPWVTDPAEFATAWNNAQYLHITTNGDTGTFGKGGVAGSALSNNGEILRVVAPGGSTEQVNDVVPYVNGFDDPDWPTVFPDGPSIYISPPPTGQYDALANDNPLVWDLSLAGFDGAFRNTLTPIYNGLDDGSPGQLATVTQGPCTAAGPASDGNGDGVVDLQDFGHFILCQGAPMVTFPLNCACFDSDSDGDVDFGDFGAFQANLTP